MKILNCTICKTKLGEATQGKIKLKILNCTICKTKLGEATQGKIKPTTRYICSDYLAKLKTTDLLKDISNVSDIGKFNSFMDGFKNG